MQILIHWLGDGGLRTARRLQTSLPDIIAGLEPRVPALPADRWHSPDHGHCAAALVVTREDLANPRLHVALDRLARGIAAPFVFNLSGSDLPLANHVRCVREDGQGADQLLVRLADLTRLERVGHPTACSDTTASRSIWGVDPDLLL